MSQVGIRERFCVRTSDRRVFRRCLRKWDYTSALRQNLTKKGAEQNINFWFGSAIHFAMEDYHGWNQYGDPRKAFYAYYNAFKADERPIGAEACLELGMSMLSYYLSWYPKHNDLTGFETLWLDEKGQSVAPFTPGAVPAVEQSFLLPLDVNVIADYKTDAIYCVLNETDPNKLILGVPHTIDGITYILKAEKPKILLINSEEQEIEFTWTNTKTGEVRRVLILPIYYHGTIDRMVIDKYNRWWLVDYKTAKGADTNKLDTDDQIAAYLWAMQKTFGKAPYGFIYIQLTKDVVKPPKRIKNGELSVDKNQKTTYALVRQEILNDYGSINNAPSKYVVFLNNLAAKETPEGDRFIRWDFVKRNQEQIQATEQNIYNELHMMLNPYLRIYPNPTRDCIWDCPLRDACINSDRGDTEALELFFTEWEERPRDEDGNHDSWRANLPTPEALSEITIEDILEQIESMSLEIEFDNEDDSTGFKFLYETDDER